ncbi:MAG TPA: DUF58 domain-containing protein [Gaiellaceae bacterium]|nr:DUF58 domain-containing protein [Gaiellaceae bacterium]
MTRRASPKLAAYATLAATAMLGALVLGRPELVVLGAPFLLALAAGLVLATPPELSVSAALASERSLEGATTDATIVVAATAAVDRLDVHLVLPRGVTAEPDENPVALRLRAGERRTLDLALSTDRWGGFLLGPIHLRAHDRLGFLAWESAAAARLRLRVYPTGEVLRRVVPARETQAYAGNEVARVKGEGIEFADMRPRASGDSLRRINWRASARRGELWVNESHPERNTDVILFVDSFAEARLGRESTLDLTVRATAALADAYVRRRDRVGLIGFGGVLRWLAPGSGIVQLYRIVDSLLDTDVVLSYSWKTVDVIPRRTLPPNALVVGLTPLLDPRGVGALLDLRARGVDVAALDVSPVPFARRPETGLDEVAFDLWTLRRDALRHRLRRAGIAVCEWHAETPLQAVLEEVTAFRRHARHVRA